MRSPAAANRHGQALPPILLALVSAPGALIVASAAAGESAATPPSPATITLYATEDWRVNLASPRPVLARPERR
jgi:hypothetical protein